MTDDAQNIGDASQRRILWIVLALNLALSAALGVTGITADSSALIANGLDNLSDSLVYVITIQDYVLAKKTLQEIHVISKNVLRTVKMEIVLVKKKVIF